MPSPELLGDLPFWPIFQTLLPDFVLAFTFFTALTYAVLGTIRTFAALLSSTMRTAG